MRQKGVDLDSVELFPSPNGTLIIRTLGITDHFEQTIEISKEFFCQMIANKEDILKSIDENNSSFVWE
jgi:hypothetical protein